uniref:Uncharacterized protein n=1 Tax=Physcomitrium patens TaxID=3218 RepID=A0A2K1L8G7_PHYPA|nr:hypothetical protein PHYPA_000741 [Physcomitrium patens]
MAFPSQVHQFPTTHTPSTQPNKTNLNSTPPSPPPITQFQQQQHNHHHRNLTKTPTLSAHPQTPNPNPGVSPHSRTYNTIYHIPSNGHSNVPPSQHGNLRNEEQTENAQGEKR